MRRKADIVSRSRSYSPSPTRPPLVGSHGVPPPGSNSKSSFSRGGGAGFFRSSRRSGGAAVGDDRASIPIWLLLLLAATITYLSHVLIPNATTNSTIENLSAGGSVSLSKSTRGSKTTTSTRQQSQKASLSSTVNGIPVNDATKRMREQESRWVDGEKALKEQLKKLAELQAQGKEMGVPALTRYLGEDFPAWAGQGVDKAKWEARRDAKYAEMREAEDEWNRKIAEIIARDKERG